MAEKFFNQLVTIEVPKDGKCMICMEAYGTIFPESGAAEKAVRLPCGHVLGSACITTWLSPNESNQNSCPCCRSELFAIPQNRDNIDNEK